MFLVIAYDVASERTEIFKKLLVKFLIHEQNSVFAGDLTESQYRKLRAALLKVAEPGDRLLQFQAANRHNMRAVALEKNPGNGALEEKELLRHSMGSLIL